MRPEYVGFVALFRDVAETGIFGEIERVLLVSGRMVFGRVEGIEAEPLGFHLGGFGHGKSYLAEDRSYAPLYLSERVQAADVVSGGGQGDVRGLAQGRGVLGIIQTCRGLCQQILDLFLGLVYGLAESGTFFLGYGCDPLHEGRQFSVPAEYGSLDLVQLRPCFN